MREGVIGTFSIGTQEVLRASNTQGIAVSVEHVRAVEHEVIALVFDDPRSLDKTSFPRVGIVGQQLHAVIADQTKSIPRQLARHVNKKRVQECCSLLLEPR